MNRKTPSIVGAAVGLALFLAIALLPALLYGGYAGVLLAGGIFGTPVQATFAVRALIVFGMVMEPRVSAPCSRSAARWLAPRSESSPRRRPGRPPPRPRRRSSQLPGPAARWSSRPALSGLALPFVGARPSLPWLSTRGTRGAYLTIPRGGGWALARKPIKHGRHGLRAKAEARLTRDPKVEASSQPSSALLHELQVHQIELEMQAEELRLDRIQLAKAHERIVDLYDFAPVGYLTLDAKGVITAANLTSTTFLGIERKDLLRRPFPGLMGQEDADRWHRFTASLAQRESRHGTLDLLLHRADGTSFDARLVCDLHAAGEEWEVRIALLNVSEARRVEETLAASEERFRALIERSSDVTMLLDEKGTFTFVSPAFQSILGLSPSEAIGRSAFEFSHPDDAPRAMQALAAAIRDPGSTQRVKVRVRRADGTWALLDASVTNMTAVPSVRGIVVNNRDVTEREQVEQDLRESQQLLLQSQEIARIGSYVFDVQGDHWSSSVALEAIFGIDGSYPRKGRDWLQIIHPADRERMALYLADLLARGSRFDREYRIVDQGSKATKWVHGLGQLQRGPGGEPLKLVGTIQDVTDRKTMDGEREALQAQLALASRLAAMGTLVAGVAHEINNPLAAILAGQGVALEEAREVRKQWQEHTPPDVEAGRGSLDLIIAALEDAGEGSQRVARIVKDLATFANPDPRRARLRLADVVANARRWLPTALGQSVDIRVEDGAPPPVLASAGQLEQVVVNLLTNAAKATPPGKRGDIVVRIGPGGTGMARLEVVDQGTGIDPGIRVRIFEPFFTTRQAGLGRGAGLGLSISHAIIAAHGGTLTVESEVGKGSTFRVELPAAPVQAE